MIRQFDLVERVLAYDPGADEALINRAYVYAMKMHGSQKRDSGDPYFSHPVEVAGILTELKADDATIATALLHDTLEDTQATHQEIRELFGPEIANLVDGITKLGRLELTSEDTRQAENFRKLLIAVSDDIRILLVKLADRLHNMRTLKHIKKPEKRARIAQETMDIYAPLAARMGMQEMREELEDLAFEELNPKVRKVIMTKLDEIRQRSGDMITIIEKELKEKLAENNITAEVMGRGKRPFSIWRKIERKGITLEQLSDVFAFRIIVASIDDCYHALGVVHNVWRAVPGRFKDYISTPKPNDYRSVHTTVIGPRRQRVELQIRTRDMHEVAEYGIAAHILYTDAGDDNVTRHSKQYLSHAAEASSAYRWLQHLVEQLKQGDTPEEFLEHTKLELFSDQVFCFTPKGLLIVLPKGAATIDFAYAVHTQIGNSCVGAKVNGRIRPLHTLLKNGDEVEIITSETQAPQPEWEQLVVTGKARSAIRRALHAEQKAKFMRMGREVVERRFKALNRPFKEQHLDIAYPTLGYKTLNDLLQAVGEGKLMGREVAAVIYPDLVDKVLPVSKRKRNRWLRKFVIRRGRTEPDHFPGTRAPGTSAPDTSVPPIRVRSGGQGYAICFAPEAGALPGDRIVGILTPSKGLVIYPIHAQALAEFDDEIERWIDVIWDMDETENMRFPTRLKLALTNEIGSLGTVASTIAELDANISHLTATRPATDYMEMQIDIEVYGLNHLNRVISKLRRLDVVSEANRIV